MCTYVEGKFYYGVQITTGSQLLAGTLNEASINLIGHKAQTGKLEMTSTFGKINFTSGSAEVFVVTSEQDLGDILVVALGCDAIKIKGLDWYVSFVAVANLQTNVMKRFPCYHWIGAKSSVSITEHTSKPSMMYESKF